MDSTFDSNTDLVVVVGCVLDSVSHTGFKTETDSDADTSFGFDDCSSDVGFE